MAQPNRRGETLRGTRGNPISGSPDTTSDLWVRTLVSSPPWGPDESAGFCRRKWPRAALSPRNRCRGGGRLSAFLEPVLKPSPCLRTGSIGFRCVPVGLRAPKRPVSAVAETGRSCATSPRTCPSRQTSRWQPPSTPPTRWSKATHTESATGTPGTWASDAAARSEPSPPTRSPPRRSPRTSTKSPAT